MDEVIERLNVVMRANKSKHWHIAKLAGMSATKLSKILNRKQVLSLSDFLAIARALELEPSRFLSESAMVVDAKKIEAAHRLSRELSGILGELVPIEVARPVVSQPKAVPSRTTTPVRAAANPNAELLVELEEKRSKIPLRAWNRGARIIARVVGDSMEGGVDPLRDGELAYLKPTRSKRTANGHVTLIRCDDGLYLKTLQIIGSRALLISANDAYDTRELDLRTERNIEIYGFVVDHQRSTGRTSIG